MPSSLMEYNKKLFTMLVDIIGMDYIDNIIIGACDSNYNNIDIGAIHDNSLSEPLKKTYGMTMKLLI